MLTAALVILLSWLFCARIERVEERIRSLETRDD